MLDNEFNVNTIIPSIEELSKILKKEISDADRELLIAWEHARSDVLEDLHEPILQPLRWRLPETTLSMTHRFAIPDPGRGELKGFLTTLVYPSGRLGKVMLTIAKEGSFVSGVMDILMSVVSLGLQHGIKLESFTRRFIHTQFEPSGMVRGAPPHLCFSKSMLDYIGNYLNWRFPNGMYVEQPERVSR